MGRILRNNRLRSDHIGGGLMIPFILVHVAPFAAFFTGTSVWDWVVCIALYWWRMVGVTMGYHRYFSHRAFKLKRLPQFLLAFWAQTSCQKGALWWASRHRHHHKYSDDEVDAHSPRDGFLWSHVGWFLSDTYDATDIKRIKDFAKYPELNWLNTYHLVPPVLLGLACFSVGGMNMFLIGFCLSTVLCWHGTFLVNSLAHVFGRQRYLTGDDSKNCWWIALLTCGEGWHNNHHKYQSSARQGFFWWEFDVTYYCIAVLAALGIAYDVRGVPERLKDKSAFLNSSAIAAEMVDESVDREPESL